MATDNPAPQEADRSVLQVFACWALDFYHWLEGDTLDQQRAFEALCNDLGLDIKKPPEFPKLKLSALEAFNQEPDPGLESWFGVVADVKRLIESITSLADAIDLGAEATAEEVVQTLLDLLTSNYVRDRWFNLYLWLELVRFSTEPMTLYGPHGTARQRFYGSLKALLKFALSPISVLVDQSMKTEADAKKWSDATLLPLAELLLYFAMDSQREIGLRLSPAVHVDPGVLEHIKVFYGFDQPTGALSPQQIESPMADAVSQRMLSVQVQALPKALRPGSPIIDGALRISLAFVPQDHGGPGLFLTVGGTDFNFSFRPSGDWDCEAHAAFDAPFNVQFGGGDTGLRFVPADADRRVNLGFTISSKPMPPGGRRRVLPLPGNNGLHVGRVALSGSLTQDEARFQLTFYDCRLALDGSSFDDFIAAILPKTQTSLEFSFGAGISSREGFFTTGDIPSLGTQTGTTTVDAASGTGNDFPNVPVVATGLQGNGIPLEIPIGKSLGPVRLLKLLLHLDRDTGPSPKALVQAALSFSTQIGPVTATVDRVGLKFGLDFPDDRSKANLHFANVDVGFIPPRGIGLLVDAKGVKGGGFLFHDEARHQYAGVMELSLSGMLALKAIGLLATRLPDGSKGYSLIILVTAENAKAGGSLRKPPLPGWRLTGVGGLIAIHRTVDDDAVRAGLANHTLASVLFPKDPVANAPSVLAAIDRVFPAKRGSYLVGLMVQLEWGVPHTIIQVNLGVIIELGGRNRYVVLGRMTAVLPRLDDDWLRLNLDALGIIDFDQGTAAIDALLVDSRLLRRFPITGSGALRARWTSPRSFALAVGGLHHGFKPPAGFPALQRLAVSLTTGDNPRLDCDAYFALTSNTVQFGAHAHLYAAAAGFSITGDAGFDVLIQMLPFHFLAEFFASMQLKRGSKNLFKVKVEGALEGPLPLSVRAKCSFEIFWCDITVRVNFTLVDGQKPTMPSAVNAMERLQAALADSRSWSAELPPGQSRIVALRESTEDSALRVHPLGKLTVLQSVVPLNLSRDIDKFSDSPVTGARRFTLSRVSVGAGPGNESLQALHDDFAPAQYFQMSDDDRLASPSFEPMQAGVRIGASDFDFALSQGVASPLEYETRIVDRRAAAPAVPPSPYVLSLERLSLHARHGAAGRSLLRQEERRGRPAPFAQVVPARFASVGKELSLQAGGMRETSFAEALADTKRRRGDQLINTFEFAVQESPS